MVKIEKVKVSEKKQLLAAATYQSFQETGHWSLWNNVTGIFYELPRDGSLIGVHYRLVT